MKPFFLIITICCVFISCKKHENLGEFQINDSTSFVWLNSIYKNVKYFNADSSVMIDASNVMQTPYSFKGYIECVLPDKGNVSPYYMSQCERIEWYINDYQFTYTLNARTDGINKWDGLVVTIGKHNPNATAGETVYILSGFRFATYFENNSFHWEEEAPYNYYDSLILDGVTRRNVYHIFANYNSEVYMSKEEGIIAFKFKDDEFLYKN